MFPRLFLFKLNIKKVQFYRIFGEKQNNNGVVWVKD